ncbi:S-layer homology domain-containing protein [Pseudobacteroides cellulosolvens]|uniref:Cellulosome anchoring protein cohesin region n=1 Tax=Pseudobacteroides cellulosolvens ATCC 35603 = DSM 2933 TaxID=398512 RepID=A0A0L6JJ57_9FIRM|nr:S-layer homology domain-containing protein [Pseudobacteroides cellulosolvens]KNY25765.1 cellulosome anchoring protein cohesin region [Pseudobacteroides cellulosolvens ATCC 35603 = DSM 2933]
MVYKRNLSAILSLLIIFSSLAISYVNVNAVNSQFILEADQTNIAKKDVIEVSLSVKDMPNFAGYQANIKFDPKVLRPIYSDATPFDNNSAPETGELLLKRYSPTDMAANDLAKGTLTFGRTYMNLTGYKANNTPESTGTIAYIYFEVLESKNTKIELQDSASLTNAVSGTMAFDWDGAQQSNYTVVGTVELIGQAQEQSPTPTIDATPTSGDATPTKRVTPTKRATPTSTPTKTNTTVTPSSSSSTPEPSQGTNVTPYEPETAIEDLAISISADKRIYNEGNTITYTIKYKNRTNELAIGVEITADILDNTIIIDESDSISEGGRIKWNIGNIDSGESGEIKYSVKVLPLSEAEVEISNTVSISASEGTGETADSTIKVLAVSNKFGKVSHKKYVQGYKGNLFLPNKEITRAEAAVMFCNILGIDVPKSKEQVFSDVGVNHWAAPYINVVNKEGIFKGFSDGRFLPNGFITRAEMATAISRFLGLSEAEPISVHFKDIANHWAVKYIEEIYRVKITSGYKDGSFLPNKKIKRAEAIVMFNNMLFRGPLMGGTSTFDDVGYDYWAIGHIEEAANDHSSTRDINGVEIIG